MSKIVQPTKGRIARCSISGIDLARHVYSVEIFEDICKPYKTARVKIMLSNPQIQNLVIKGAVPGTKVQITLDSGIGTYSDTFYVSKKSQSDPVQSGRSELGVLELIGQEFFRDNNLVTKAIGVGKVPTDAIKQIHSEFMGTALSILQPAINVLAKQTSHIIDNKNPITAIRGLAGMANYARYSPGTTLYFRDRDKMVLAPLSYLFESSPIAQSFKQSFTTGKYMGENFGDFGAYNIIMSVTPMSIGDSIPQSSGINEIAAGVRQMNTKFDMATKKLEKTLAKDITPDKFIGNISGFLDNAKSLVGVATSLLGSQPNFQLRHSTNQYDDSTNFQSKTPEAILSAGVAQNGPSYSIRVPAQSGIKCTVGQRVNCKFINPSGEFRVGTSPIDGPALVTRIRHCLIAGDKVKNPFITDLECVKGGVNT